MIPLTERAHAAVSEVLRPGGTAIDATAGNGHDTLWLANHVGVHGRVYAFDVQSAAIEATTRLLRDAGLEKLPTLINADHEEMDRHLPADCQGQVDAGMFNLGYLPGGDKALTTRTDSTIAAINTAIEWLRPGGILTVLAYPGHPAGAEETAAVTDRLRSLETEGVIRCEERQSDYPSERSPRLFVVRKTD